jgi:hypothetical protein
MNPITGHKQVDINGKLYTLRFTWAAMAEIEQKWGEAPNLFDPAVLAGVAAAGFRDKHPELTAEKLMELSPPIAPFVQSVQEAIRWACFGDQPIDGVVKKKVSRSGGGLWQRLRRLFQRG